MAQWVVTVTQHEDNGSQIPRTAHIKARWAWQLTFNPLHTRWRWYSLGKLAKTD